jgi:ribose transport system ATP-binding protein
MAERADGAVVSLRGIRKSFPGTRALDGVSIELQPGEVHALLGGNGSGKSTLIKIMAGVYTADAGDIEVQGTITPGDAFTPELADSSGLRFVHQQDSGFPTLTVTENLFAGHHLPTLPGGVINWRAAHRLTRQVLEEYGLDINARALFGELRPAAQQMVVIARALFGTADVCAVVLDEPTASLPPAEVEHLLESVRGLVARGLAVMYVTHRLDELPGFAARATVLKDGRVAGTMRGDELTHERMIDLITGGLIIAGGRPTQAHPGGDVILAVSNLSAGPVRDANLEVRAGEVLGISGLVGSGRTSLLRAIFGDLRQDAGSITLKGRSLKGGVASAVAAGIAMVPENRLTDAVFAQLRLDENLVGAALENYRGRTGLLNYKSAVHDAAELKVRYAIKASSLASPLEVLSGGNQQKAVLARWMHRNPSLILLDEPTQGVDVGARAEIHEIVRDAARRGAAVVVVSSDVEELAVLCDRVVGMVRGATMGELSGADISTSDLERLAYGRTA